MATGMEVKTDSGPEHWAPRNPAFESSFDEFAGLFCSDRTEFLAARGVGYEDSREAFDFGYLHGASKRWKRHAWADVEARLRAEWEKAGRSRWESLRGMVELGWDSARGL
jgi:hypothetical protein